MKFINWVKHLSNVEQWINFSLKDGQVVQDRQLIRCLLSTIDHDLKDKVDDFKDIETKKEALEKTEEVLLIHFPPHNRRVMAMDGKKKDSEDVSTFIKQVSIMYDEAKLITITKNILLLHHVLQEIAEIEPHKKILNCISGHLGELILGGDLDLMLCLNGITKIEAERRTRGLPTTGK